MEKRTDSPFPGKDRPILAAVGVLLIASTVLFAWSDRKHDWRYYQLAFKQQVSEKYGVEKAKTVPSGVATGLGRRPETRGSLRHVPPGRVLERVREGGGAVPVASRRAA